jgi:hypothetical protein
MLKLTPILMSHGFNQRQLALLAEKAEGKLVTAWAQRWWLDSYMLVKSLVDNPRGLSLKEIRRLRSIKAQLVFCEYPGEFHRGKVQWHHPIEGRLDVGLDLCEAHHQILQGRKTKYWGEVSSGKSLEEIQLELKELEKRVVEANGLSCDLINKH